MTLSDRVAAYRPNDAMSVVNTGMHYTYTAIPNVTSQPLTANVHHIAFYYRAMHFSANARSWDRMSSVRLSVCL